MLNGVLTGAAPEGDRRHGRATFHAVLTPKGKMVTDLRALLVSRDPEVLLLDVPVSGSEPFIAHLKKYVPPRFAKVADISDDMGALTITGAEAAEAVSGVSAAGAGADGSTAVTAEALGGLAAGEWTAPDGDPSRLVIVRSDEVWPPAFTILGRRDLVSGVQKTLTVSGMIDGSAELWRTLRLEAEHSPVYGIDMDDTVIPVEAGINLRAIDYHKGCYTGQEVIVRIRDRGRVNRHLRRLRLGGMAPPPAGTPLSFPDTGKPAGYVTSSAWSPRFRETVALAYVRREAEEVLVEGRTVSAAGG